MREFFLIVGTGEKPDGFRNFERVETLEKHIGIIGHANIHLHGKWETIITPEQLRMAMLNLNFNRQPPTVTVSL